MVDDDHYWLVVRNPMWTEDTLSSRKNEHLVSSAVFVSLILSIIPRRTNQGLNIGKHARLKMVDFGLKPINDSVDSGISNLSKNQLESVIEK